MSRIVTDCNEETIVFIADCPHHRSLCGGKATMTWKYCEEFCDHRKKHVDGICLHLQKELLIMKHEGGEGED